MIEYLNYQMSCFRYNYGNSTLILERHFRLADISGGITDRRQRKLAMHEASHLRISRRYAADAILTLRTSLHTKQMTDRVC